jgi:excisionase family DNA binding protein
VDIDIQGVLAVGVGEAARRLGLSPRTVTTLVRNGDLTSRKIGRRRVIPVKALVRFLGRDHQLPTFAARQTNIGKRQ